MDRLADRIFGPAPAPAQESRPLSDREQVHRYLLATPDDIKAFHAKYGESGVLRWRAEMERKRRLFHI